MSYYTQFNNIKKGHYTLSESFLSIKKEPGKIRLEERVIEGYRLIDLYKDNRIVVHGQRNRRTYKPKYPGTVKETLNTLLDEVKQSLEYRQKRSSIRLNKEFKRISKKNKRKKTYEECIQKAAEIFLSNPE